MANIRKIVTRIGSLEPSGRGGGKVVLPGGQEALIPGGAASVLLLRILDNLRRTRRPVYLELDAASRVRRLLLPRIVTVLGLDEIPSGDLAVRVEPSNLPHILRRSNPEFGVLRKALAKPGAVLLTETDAHEIVDVRPARKPASKAVSSRKRAKAASAVTMAQARTLFDLVATASCDPMTVPPPCIPFLYPDDGCWVRAHEMCRRIVAAGVEPAKIWLSGGLNVTTPNNPNCKLFWYYHVAPTVQVASSSGSEKLYVLDPSMFDEPVTDQVWMAAMNNPNAAVKRTPWTQYNLGGGEDPDFSQTEDGLIWLRDSLLLRSAGPDGPPPYAHCLTAAP